MLECARAIARVCLQVTVFHDKTLQNAVNSKNVTKKNENFAAHEGEFLRYRALIKVGGVVIS